MLTRRQYNFRYYRNGNELLIPREYFTELQYCYKTYFKIKDYVFDRLSEGYNSGVLIDILKILDMNERPIYVPKINVGDNDDNNSNSN